MFFFSEQDRERLTNQDRERLTNLVAWERVFGRRALSWEELEAWGLELGREEAAHYLNSDESLNRDESPSASQRKALYKLLFAEHPELELSVFSPQEWRERLEKRRRDTFYSSDVSKSAGEVAVQVEGHADSGSLDSYKVAAGITPGVMASGGDPRRERAALTYEAVIAFLDANPGTHTFGDVAEGLGIPRSKGGRAVGAMMRAIHNRGLHEYCVRVVNAKTRKHGCDNAGD